MDEPARHGAAAIPEAKQQAVAELAEKLGRMRSLVITDYRGLSVAQLADLRAQLKAAEVEYLVVKNTLARRAEEEAGLAQLTEQMVGPTALAISYEDVSAPARLLVEYARSSRRAEMVRGGFAEGQQLDAGEVRRLAELPPREALMAQLMAVLEAPVAQLAQLIQSPGIDLVGLLEAQAGALGGAPG